MNPTDRGLFDTIFGFQQQIADVKIEQGTQRVMLVQTKEAIDGLNASITALTEAVKGLTDAETLRKGEAQAIQKVSKHGWWVLSGLSAGGVWLAENWKTVHDFLSGGPKP